MLRPDPLPFYRMKGPAVSQASRRFGIKMSQDEEIKEKVAEIFTRIQGMLNVET